MQTIGKASRSLLVPAFVAAALAFGATATTQAHATDNPYEDPCTDDMMESLEKAGIREIGPTNVTVTAEADGGFEVTWDNPSSPPAPAGLVTGFCMNKAYRDGDDEVEPCWCREGLCIHSSSSLTSVSADSCYGPRGLGDAPCLAGAHKFRIKLEPACPHIGNPYSDYVEAESTLEAEVEAEAEVSSAQ